MIIVMIIMLLMSAFFSASETALISASPAKIHKMKTEGVKRALTLANLLDHKEKIISVLLMGNNFVNIASSTIATAITINVFGESGKTLAAATGIMTFVIIIYCEILPKTFAVRNPEMIALAVAPICSVLVKILAPLNYIIQKIVAINLAIFPLKKVKVNNVSVLEELKGAIEHQHEKGLVVHEDKYMIGGLIDLEKILVSEVMVYRKDIFSINIDDNMETILSLLINNSYSRIPVWEGSAENIIGVLNIKDLLALFKKNLDLSLTREGLRSILRQPWFIPSTTNLKTQLNAFREMHNHFALVVDEYGELDGLITLEDVVEEVVGQIEDEYDDSQENKIIKNGDGSVTVKGDLSIRDLNRETHWELPEKGAATVGGLMFHIVESIPEVGDIVSIDRYKLRLVKKRHNKIIKIRIEKTS